MIKTLPEMAAYIKTIMVPETDEAYPLKPDYEALANPERIRAGVVALRAFLEGFYDRLIAEGDAYDIRKEVAHAYENRTTISIHYPFLNNTANLLIRMGYRGVLADGGQTLVCGGDIFNEKLSTPKSLACLQFLAACGFAIDGVDLNDKKQNLPALKTIRVSYPPGPALLTGMKAMATAEIDHRTLENQDVFLRCDYSVLKLEPTDPAIILQNAIAPLPGDIRQFVMGLHERYTAQGVACAVEIKGFFILVKYLYRRKELWGVNISLNNGYEINVKAAHTDQYPELVATFPPALQEMIAKGYGCGRKRPEVGHCDGGCRGMRFALDEQALAMRADIEAWFDRELLCLQKK